MHITIVSLDDWGFNEYLATHLSTQGHITNHIDLSTFKYQYPNFFTKVYNFLSKVFLSKNIKRVYYGKEIIKQLRLVQRQDIILTLNASFIDKEALLEMRQFTDKSVFFINDSIKRFPDTLNVLDCFDEVFSFEKGDCEKHNLKFATNFIYKEDCRRNVEEKMYTLFNISAHSKRTAVIIKIAQALKKWGFTYRIIILDKKKEVQSNLLEVIHEPVGLEKVHGLASAARVLLDIHRNQQEGLSFRIFESIGTHKKLITTNKTIREYDFYNEQNIFIIEDEKDFSIDKQFLEQPYVPIDDAVYAQYTLSGWCKQVLGM